MKGNIKMHVQLDKHDITMICEALEYMIDNVEESESKGLTVAYNKDEIETMICYLDGFYN
jgi:hypothetical protein|tara:strand:+ start:723 stop:902 length:180 start_codon:yes stop_codon:yes gene_type:complete